MLEFEKVMAVVAVLFVAPALMAAPPPEIRVLVVDNVPSVSVEGAGKTMKVSAAENGLRRGRTNLGNSIAVQNRASRYRINGRTFRGSLDVIWKSNGSLSVVNHISLEDYLSGLINSEISSSWPDEAIKTQAVAARTYALNQIEGAERSATPRAFDITSTMFDQVYEGAHQEDGKSRRMVEATAGEVLLRDGEIFPAYYHSSCGGKTEHAGNVWEGEAGPPVVDDPYCKGSPKFAWEYEIFIQRFVEIMNSQGFDMKTVRTAAVLQYDDSPRAEILLIEDEGGIKMARATDLRRIFGYQNIKSTWFDAEVSGQKIIFRGRGYGHGVGLCQWGSKGLAEQGAGYRDILKFYYPDADVAKIY